MCSWNIAGVRDKLQKPDILRFLLVFHTVWLFEMKTNSQIHVPGFTVYSNSSRHHQHRGGVMMLVKNSLVSCVAHVDMSFEGQI